MKKLILLLILIPNILYAGSMKATGEKGKEANIDRTITVLMYDNYYEPKNFDVKSGETIKFEVENLGELVHEFNIGNAMMHKKHQPEMQRMVDNEILFADTLDREKMKKKSN